MRRVVSITILAISLVSCGQSQQHNNAPIPIPTHAGVRKYIDPETGTVCYLYGSEIECIGRNGEGQ